MEKQIANPGQAYSLGANYGTPPVDNTMTTEIAVLVNQTGQVLYTGDIVALDATGTSAVLATTATLSLGIGTVGSYAEMSAYPALESIAGANVTNTFPTILGSTGGTGISALTTDGNVQPIEDPAFQTLTVGFTNGSSNVTSALVSTANPLQVGFLIYTPYNASTNANPQVFIVVSNGGSSGSWTAVVAAAPGTAFASTFQGTTGSFSCQVGRDYTTKGPGWQAPPSGWSNSSAFPPGVVVPVVIRGFGRVNINGLTTQVAGSFILPTNASVVGTLVLITALTAAQIGLVIAACLEAYAQRDTTLGTVIGTTGHDSVRAIIGKM